MLYLFKYTRILPCLTMLRQAPNAGRRKKAKAACTNCQASKQACDDNETCDFCSEHLPASPKKAQFHPVDRSKRVAYPWSKKMHTHALRQSVRGNLRHLRTVVINQLRNEASYQHAINGIHPDNHDDDSTLPNACMRLAYRSQNAGQRGLICERVAKGSKKKSDGIGLDAGASTPTRMHTKRRQPVSSNVVMRSRVRTTHSYVRARVSRLIHDPQAALRKQVHHLYAYIHACMHTFMPACIHLSIPTHTHTNVCHDRASNKLGISMSIP
jgi:hypothetical protein